MSISKEGKKQNKNRTKKTNKIIENQLSFLIFSIAFIIYFISKSPTPYDYFTRLADSFIKGKFYLDYSLPWLNELIPISTNKFYVVYPPMPAIMLTFFRTIFGYKFTQDILSYLIGALTNVVIFKIGFLTTNNFKKSLIGTFIFSFGSIFWYMSSVASAWYLGQIISVFFISLALFYSLKKKNVLSVGVFLGASYLSRVHTILLTPYFVFINLKNNKNIFYIFLGLTPFLLFNFYYNYSRFGTIFDKGYFLIPNLFNEPWYQKGLFHYSYIWRHIKVAFFTLPNKNLSFNGLSIWATSPVFLYAFKAKLSKNEFLLLVFSIFLYLIPVVTHGTNGFAQFGYRMILETYPFIMLLIFKYLSKNKISITFLLLTTISFLMNLWGIIKL